MVRIQPFRYFAGVMELAYIAHLKCAAFGIGSSSLLASIEFFSSRKATSWGYDGIGRLDGLRSRCRKAWEFDSPYPHIYALWCNDNIRPSYGYDFGLIPNRAILSFWMFSKEKLIGLIVRQRIKHLNL